MGFYSELWKRDRVTFAKFLFQRVVLIISLMLILGMISMIIFQNIFLKK